MVIDWGRVGVGPDHGLNDNLGGLRTAAVVVDGCGRNNSAGGGRVLVVVVVLDLDVNAW